MLLLGFDLIIITPAADINWEIVLIQPNMEYLLLPENEDKIMNNIDKPEIKGYRLKTNPILTTMRQYHNPTST